MAHFLYDSTIISEYRSNCIRLLSALLIGSVFGALCAKLQSAAFFVTDPALRQTSLLLILFRAFPFPGLLYAAYLLRRSLFFYALFFLKGAFSAFTLCAFAAQGVSMLCPILPILLLPSCLTLPCAFWAGSVWLQNIEDSSFSRLPLILLLLFTLLGALVQSFLLR